MSNIETLIAGAVEDPRTFNVTPSYYDVDEPFESWHAFQQELRFGPKPYSAQYQDAIFADLDARGIEYESHPFEEVFAFVNAIFPGEYYDLDDPWYFSDQIQPQLALFERLDREQNLAIIREPEEFRVKEISDELLRATIQEFLDSATARDPYWETVSPGELLEYYHHRKNQIEKHANDRLTQLRGEK